MRLGILRALQRNQVTKVLPVQESGQGFGIQEKRWVNANDLDEMLDEINKYNELISYAILIKTSEQMATAQEERSLYNACLEA